MPVPAVFVPSFVLTFVPSLPSVTASLREIESSVYSGLARDYGSFMLQNALAISLALDIEDGEMNGTAVVSFVVVDVYVMHALFRSSRRGSCIMG